MFENNTVKLSDLCTDVSYGYTASANDQKVGPKFLRITDIQGGEVEWSDVPFCKIDDKNLVKNKLEDGDIVVARTGNSTGENYLYSSSEEAVFASYLIRFRINFELANPYFVWLQMRTLAWWNYVSSSKSGSAQAGANAKVLGGFEFYLPGRNIQNKAAEVIFDVNQKQALNRQTNQTLEAIARAIFKSWFVDFEPTRAKLKAKQNDQNPERAAMAAISGKTVEQLDQLSPKQQQQLKTTAALFPDALEDSELGEIPKGWEVKPLGNYLEIKRGGSPRPIREYIVEKGLPWTKIADATSDPSPFLFKTKECIKEEGLKKTVFLKKGSLILSNSATPGLPKFLELDACIHDGWLHFPKKKLFTDVYLYQLFLEIRKELVAQGNGSVFTNLKTDILRNQVVVVPSQHLIEQFDKTVVVIFLKLKENCKEINTLADIRDTLLPKLLSGELDTSIKDVA